MRSIRKTLLVGAIGAMVVLLLASGSFLFFTVRASLLSQFDDALIEQAQVLATGVEVNSGRVIFDDEDFDMDEFESDAGPSYLQIQTDEDESIYRSASLGSGTLHYVPDENDEPEVHWVRLPAGRDGRAVYAFFAPVIDAEDNSESETAIAAARRDRIELILARDIAPVMDAIGRLELILLSFGVGTIAVASALLYAVIGRALKPLDALAAEIGAIEPNALSSAVSIRDCPDELKPVVERLNELLARLKHAIDRERDFNADVAHELRTPLAGIRSTLEVALSRQRTTPEYVAALNACLEVSEGMQSMVENLLTLARLDSGRFEIVTEEIDLDAILESTLQPLWPDFAKRAIDVQRDVERNLKFESDASLLHIVVRNVLDNALSYTNDSGWVHVSARVNGKNAVLCVRNSGIRLTLEQSASVLDRFWRADASRSQTGTHCGLGLSLVQKIATTLGGTVEVESGKDGVFGIVITIPKKLDRA